MSMNGAIPVKKVALTACHHSSVKQNVQMVRGAEISVALKVMILNLGSRLSLRQPGGDNSRSK